MVFRPIPILDWEKYCIDTFGPKPTSKTPKPPEFGWLFSLSPGLQHLFLLVLFRRTSLSSRGFEFVIPGLRTWYCSQACQLKDAVRTLSPPFLVDFGCFALTILDLLAIILIFSRLFKQIQAWFCHEVGLEVLMLCLLFPVVSSRCSQGLYQSNSFAAQRRIGTWDIKATVDSVSGQPSLSHERSVFLWMAMSFLLQTLFLVGFSR